MWNKEVNISWWSFYVGDTFCLLASFWLILIAAGERETLKNDFNYTQNVLVIVSHSMIAVQFCCEIFDAVIAGCLKANKLERINIFLNFFVKT